MPELPDITIYVERLSALCVGQAISKVRLVSPFLLRTAVPPITSVENKKLLSVQRLGKRIVFSIETDLFLVIHLMIAGRLHWAAPQAAIPKKNGLAALDFGNGSLIITESGSKKRASMHLVQGRDALSEFDTHGLETLSATEEAFRAVLVLRNHTLKRALTDPWLFSGIGNSYSDEILHRARLSPIAQTQKLGDDDVHRLYRATRQVLVEWVERLRAETGTEFPEKVTAFRPEMAVHGKFGKPCPVCGTPIQRIRYADNETNYCPVCQTGGRLLADRAMSSLMKKDWPKTLDQLENLKARHRGELSAAS
jgi:formamidopyrimidine-DNA glycosylase